LRLRAMDALSAQPMDFVRRWAGKGFFVFATGWILCVFSLMHPPAPDAAFQPLPDISLPDSRGFEVHLHMGAYDVERSRTRRIEDCGCWNVPGWSENDLMLAALGPPLAIVLASLLWIGVSGARIKLARIPVGAGS
jgi:hypothetical protein